MSDLREFHFCRASEAGDPAARTLPIGRIEETAKGPRFYYTGRLRSPERILEFAERHPDLVLCNERDEPCDPRQVADEIRGMKIGTAGSGSRFGSGMGAPYSDLSAWDVKDAPRITARRVLTALLVLSLCINGAFIAYFCWQGGTVTGAGTYINRSAANEAAYLVLLEDGTYLHFPSGGDRDAGSYTLVSDGLCTLSAGDSMQASLAVLSRSGQLSVLGPDGSVERYEKLRYTPAFIEQQLG